MVYKTNILIYYIKIVLIYKQKRFFVWGKTKVFIMNNINYENAMLKYGVSDLLMSDLAKLMLEDKNLSESMHILSKDYDIKHIDLKQLYVLASSISSSIMGEELSIVSPRMQKERKEIVSSAILKFQSKAPKRNDSETLELIFEEIEEAIFELDAVAL